jgi:hypothetical protein
MGFAFGYLPYRYHQVWGHWTMRVNKDLSIDVSDPVLGKIEMIYQFHGLALYISWGALVVIQLGSVRYIRFKWRWNMWLHAVVGVLSGITAIAACFQMLSRF